MDSLFDSFGSEIFAGGTQLFIQSKVSETDREFCVTEPPQPARIPAEAKNPWIKKYIFPGGYIPTLSEGMRAVENTQLWLADFEGIAPASRLYPAPLV